MQYNLKIRIKREYQDLWVPSKQKKLKRNKHPKDTQKKDWQKHHQEACANNQETKKPKRNPLESQVHPGGKSRQKGEKTTPGSRENFVKLFGKLSLNYKW